MTKPDALDVSDPIGPVPADNQPGHHPEVDQDKPRRLPRRPRPAGAVAVSSRFPFAVEARMLPFSLAALVTPWTAWVDLDEDRLEVRFGPWRLRTARSNIAAAQVTGPYAFAKVAGPPHLSFADRGLTMATTTERGVCIRFAEPVSVLPLLRHPAVTVTVADPEALVTALS
jgi:hypothetical protein